MITENILNIYEVSHRYLREPELVVANSVEEAINKFSAYYESDIDIFPDGIIGVALKYTFEVLDEHIKYEKSW